MKRDSLEDFQRAVNKLAEHAEAMRSGCISAYCWVEWHMGLSAVRRSETAFINVPLERVHLMSQEWRNYECIIRETRGRETVARAFYMASFLKEQVHLEIKNKRKGVFLRQRHPHDYLLLSAVSYYLDTPTWKLSYLTWLLLVSCVLQVISWGITVYWTSCARRAMRWSTH